MTDFVMLVVSTHNAAFGLFGLFIDRSSNLTDSCEYLISRDWRNIIQRQSVPIFSFWTADWAVLVFAWDESGSISTLQYRLSFDLPNSKEPEDKFHPTNHPYGEHHTYTGVGCAQCGRPGLPSINRHTTVEWIPSAFSKNKYRCAIEHRQTSKY